MRLLLPKQCPEAFLLEMLVICERADQSFTAHHLHRNAIRQAILLVGAAFIEKQPFHKAVMALRYDAYIMRRQNASYRFRRPVAECFIGGTKCEYLREYFLRGEDSEGLRRSTPFDYSLVAAIFAMNERDPIEGIGEDAVH